MIFDLFHSVSDPVVSGIQLGPVKSVQNFLRQAQLAEALGMSTVWVAESHFCSETQKRTSVATIQNFEGQVGLNCDSFQLFDLIRKETKKIGMGTAIHNIVGGSGGPIPSAERVNFYRFRNEYLEKDPRQLWFGIASGRFPFQNTPFGIVPRDEGEALLWPILKRYIFLEALEVFIRLLRGEEISSNDVSSYLIEEREIRAVMGLNAENILASIPLPYRYVPRWKFETLSLVPRLESNSYVQLVLGSHDPEAMALAQRWWDLDLFNLSFTPPDRLDVLHQELSKSCEKKNWKWNRSRLPRTVLVFIDKDRKKARELASQVVDTYIEAMKGTAQVPNKEVLLQRALIGDAAEIREQLHPDNPRRFHASDRLMLWFEFNQLDSECIERSMRYFSEEVVSKI